MSPIILDAMSSNQGLVEDSPTEHLPVELHRVIMIQTLRQRFDMEIDSMRQLLRSSRVSQQKPVHIRELAKEIGEIRQRKGEDAAQQLDREITVHLDQVIASGQTSDGPKEIEVADVGVPLELVVASKLDQIGDSRIGEIFNRFQEACGGDASVATYASYYFHWLKREDPVNTLRRSILPILVADFEEFLAGVVRVHCLSSGEWRSPVDALREATKKGRKAVVGYPQNWSDTISKLVGLQVDKILGKDWNQVNEIFARRHTIAHSGGRVDQKYRDRTRSESEPALPLQSILTCDGPYLENAISLFGRLADLLAVAFAAELAPGTEVLVDFALGPIFRALQSKRWAEAKIMADLVAKDMPSNHQYHELRVNRWMASEMLINDEPEELDELREQIRAWSPQPRSPRYELAKAILLGNERIAISSLKDWFELEQPSVPQLRAWPLIDYMRKRSKQFDREFVLLSHRNPERKRLSQLRNGRRRR
ncbi:MAG: hypothetical protein ACYCU8_15995 [Ferrimicrobium acidiphilum]